MTSERRGRKQCFVYLQLPQSLEVVTCGRFEREVTRGGQLVGRFVYGRSYRARRDAVPLDNFRMPLQSKVIETAALGGMFGALRDASPDHWGRRVIEHELGRFDLDEMDFLLHSPEDRAGALSFGRAAAPPAPVARFNQTVQLEALLELAEQIERDDLNTAQLAQVRALLDPGTSLGGARPKNVVEDDDGLWVAKFPARDDRWDNAAVEAGLLSLASRCGIHVPPLRIEQFGERRILLVKRFDRERVTSSTGHAYLRSRMLSALTVLNAEESPADRSRWSYLLLADELRRWSHRARDDRAELFRRMVFNALVSNLDDHPRNHAIVAPGAEWHLAPAYDITPDPVLRQERDLAMICGEHGRQARRENLLSSSGRFGLAAPEAARIIDEMRAIVSNEWRSEVRRRGGSQRDCERIQPAFDYPGFDYPLESSA